MAGRAGAILPIALGVVLARWGGAVGAPRSSQRLRRASRRAAMTSQLQLDGHRSGLCILISRRVHG